MEEYYQQFVKNATIYHGLFGRQSCSLLFQSSRPYLFYRTNHFWLYLEAVATKSKLKVKAWCLCTGIAPFGDYTATVEPETRTPQIWTGVHRQHRRRPYPPVWRIQWRVQDFFKWFRYSIARAKFLGATPTFDRFREELFALPVSLSVFDWNFC